MAGVTCRKRGTYWEYRFDLATVDGKRKQHSKSGFRTKMEAMKAGTQALAKYNRGGEIAEPSQMSLADWVHRWLDTTVRTGCTASTYDTYKRISQTIVLPVLGGYRLSSLSRIVISGFVGSLCSKGYARNSIRLAIAVLTSCLRSAVRLGLIDSFPRECFAIPKGYEKVSNKRKAITPEEFGKVVDAIPELYRPALYIGWMTGMRAGEILALRWSDIDFDADTIHIERQIGKDVLSPPKDGSERVIRMGKELHSYLYNLHQKQMRNEICYGYHYLVGEDPDSPILIPKGEAKDTDPYRLVVCKESGDWLRYNALRQRLLYAGRDVRVKCDMHTLRHTHATLLLEAGVPPKAVQQRLGHKTIKVTMEIYAHVTERMQDTLVDTIDHNPVFSWSKCGQIKEKTRL